jgi:hypothetical protein
MTLYIGFGNKARQGKDSCATAIRDYYESQNEARLAHLNTWTGSIRVGIFKYATALYREVNEFLKTVGLDWDSTSLEIPSWVQPEPNAEVSELAPYGKHPTLLQWWGTDYRRAQDTDYWVKKLFQSIPVITDIALISDVRFPNEAEGIKQRGGYNVNVQRLNADGSVYVSEDRPADHPSETALDNWNWDFKLIGSHGHAALLGEQAITLCEYLRGLSK